MPGSLGNLTRVIFMLMNGWRLDVRGLRLHAETVPQIKFLVLADLTSDLSSSVKLAPRWCLELDFQVACVLGIEAGSDRFAHI